MTKILIEFGDTGPEACIRDFGLVNLSDFYLSGSKPAREYVEKQYRKHVESPNMMLEMDDKDIEAIKRLASDSLLKTNAEQIDKFQKHLNTRYGISVPEDTKA